MTCWVRRGCNALQQSLELIHRETSLPDNSPQRTFCYFVMVRHDYAPMRCHRLPENNVAAMLAILFLADFQ